MKLIELRRVTVRNRSDKYRNNQLSLECFIRLFANLRASHYISVENRLTSTDLPFLKDSAHSSHQ